MKTVNTCPVCRKRTVTELFLTRDRMHGIPGAFGMCACKSCGTYILSPRPTERELPRYYPPEKYYAYQGSSGGFFSTLRSYLMRHYYRPTALSLLLSTVIHNVPAIPTRRPAGRVLDVGCGTGDTLLILKELGWDVYGMDMDKRAVTLAKKRGVTHAKVGAYQKLADYQDNYFDAIRLYHVIEHLDDPVRCLTLLCSKLKIGGELIIGTPNAASLVARAAKTHWYNLDSPRHLLLFSPDTLSGLVERSGFSVNGVEFCSAGGIVGSIGYFAEDTLRRKLNLVHWPWLVMLFYPLEWILDKMGHGDVFVLRARKKRMS